MITTHCLEHFNHFAHSRPVKNTIQTTQTYLVLFPSHSYPSYHSHHSIGVSGTAITEGSSAAHDLSLMQDASGIGISQDQQASDAHARSTRGRW